MPERWQDKLCEQETEIIGKIWNAGLDIKIEHGQFHLVRDPDGISGINITLDRRLRSLFQRVLDTDWYIVFDDGFGKGLFFSEWEDPARRERLFKLILLELGNQGMVVTRFPKPAKETDSIVAGEIIGMAPAIVEMVQIIEKAARTNRGTVLFLGPSGSGKESAAKYLHTKSDRRDKPFITVNCAAIPDTLIESELFGHEKGAFTDAKVAKPGYFELADGGTIFLDEIGDLSPSAQAKILRVLEAREVQRVGGTRKIKIDVRVVAATNRDLTKAVEEGEFREDLYYRLAIVDINVPPLNQRKEDIPLIVKHLLGILKDEIGVAGEQEVSDEAMSCLMKYDWPGNIRELRNVLEKAMVLYADWPILTEKCFPEIYSTVVTSSGNSATVAESEQPRGLRALKRKLVLEALAKHKGNKTRVSRELGISRHTIRIWLKPGK